MNNDFTLADYDAAADFIRSRTTSQSTPQLGMILGSGLSPLAEQIEDAIVIPYGEIPHFPISTVHGHAGRLVVGRLAGMQVVTMQGRFHFYEGYSMQQVTLPVRVMHRLGIRELIVTNAAGGINTNFQVGDLMLIEDHLNLIGMPGNNPLRGPNMEEFGTRFPPMNRTYTKRLRDLTRDVAAEIDMTVQSGVYAALAGPNFESPAEIRYLRTIGADAVGMSTAPEAIVAHHAGMELLGISTITNMCIDTLDSGTEPTHEEVNEAGKVIVPKLIQLLQALLARMAA